MMAARSVSGTGRRHEWLQKLGFIALVVLAVWSVATFTYRYQGQSPVYSGPYFSGAANLDPARPFEWHVCLDQLEEFRDLTAAELDEYRFQPCTDGYRFEFNEIGFLWVAYVARTMFPWMSDRLASIRLQLIVHVVVVVAVMQLLATRRARWVFFLLYAINPVVLYYVQFPYRYFWASVVSATFLFAICKGQWTARGMGILSLLGPALFFIRQTVLPLQLLTFVRLAFSSRLVLVVTGLAIFGSIVAFAPKIQKGPWHTIYVGIGAYPNPYVHGLSDDNGYAFYAKVTGKHLQMSSPDDNYYQKEVYESYRDVLRAEVERILGESPMMFARNAILNILQGFSVGHPVGRPMLAYVSSAIGLGVICILLLTRQYWLLLGIGASSIGFAPYFPPIPAYMFGAYILITFGLVRALEHWRRE